MKVYYGLILSTKELNKTHSLLICLSIAQLPTQFFVHFISLCKPFSKLRNGEFLHVHEENTSVLILQLEMSFLHLFFQMSIKKLHESPTPHPFLRSNDSFTVFFSTKWQVVGIFLIITFTQNIILVFIHSHNLKVPHFMFHSCYLPT